MAISADGFKPFTGEIIFDTYIYVGKSVRSYKKKKLVRGDLITAVGKDKKVVEIDDMQDNWYKVKYKNMAGWVYGGYFKFLKEE